MERKKRQYRGHIVALKKLEGVYITSYSLYVLRNMTYLVVSNTEKNVVSRWVACASV